MTPAYPIEEAICQTFNEALDFYGFDYEEELTSDEVILILTIIKHLSLKN